MSDTIYRADAIEAVAEDLASVLNVSKDETRELAEHALLVLPSAEAEPTVIRSKTLLPTKDFKELAKRIKEVNPNAVVISCDAEVASAEAVSEDTQIKTELTHIKARLENVEKRLQGLILYGGVIR